MPPLLVAWKQRRNFSKVHLAQGLRPKDSAVIWRAWCGREIPGRAEIIKRDATDICRKCLEYFSQSQEAV